jgi:hypothetical protein
LGCTCTCAASSAGCCGARLLARTEILDRAATDLSKANFDDGTGTVHVEGHLVLNDDPVRCIADIDLATLGGTGRLALEEKVAAAAE